MARKILVADDEQHILKLIASRLKAAEYEVVTASDGVQTVMKAHEEKPDLIILDVKMPAGTGTTVYENLQASIETALIPIIFITAYPTEELQQKVLEMGAEDFIPKPLNIDNLLVRVKWVLKKVGNE